MIRLLVRSALAVRRALHRYYCWMGCHEPEPISDQRVGLATKNCFPDGWVQRGTHYFRLVRCRYCRADLPPQLAGGCRICGAGPHDPCDAGLHG